MYIGIILHTLLQNLSHIYIGGVLHTLTQQPSIFRNVWCGSTTGHCDAQ